MKLKKFVRIFLYIFKKTYFFPLYIGLWSCSEFYLASPRDLFGIRKGRPYYLFSFSCPLKKQKRISQRFRPAKNLKHTGIDFPAPKGTPIHAAHTGKIIHAGKKYTGYGKMIILEYDESMASLYAHLSEIQVKKGQRVEKGQIVGLVGNTGRSSAPHLHFEVIFHKQPLDPLFLLPKTCVR